MRNFRKVVATAMPVACLVLSACAHAQRPTASADFSGTWSVKWCDQTDPEADCGGFTVTLAQDGDLLRGESFGARIRLAQIDEAGVVHGLVNGDTAVLTVQSGRSGAIYLAQASVRGDCMSWKVRDTVQPAQRDIDIVAFDDVLTRSGAKQVCPSVRDNADRAPRDR